jgi:hypothetical protein
MAMVLRETPHGTQPLSWGIVQHICLMKRLFLEEHNTFVSVERQFLEEHNPIPIG